jgi:hypothetical protein
MHAANTELAPERRAIERIKRKATAMAIAAATETSFADEVETEPDLEPDPGLHLRGRSCRCPVANVTAYREEGEWVCHTRGHQPSPRVASLLTLTTRKRAGGKPSPPQTPPRRKRSTRRPAHRTIPLDRARSTSAG